MRSGAQTTRYHRYRFSSGLSSIPRSRAPKLVRQWVTTAIVALYHPVGRVCGDVSKSDGASQSLFRIRFIEFFPFDALRALAGSNCGMPDDGIAFVVGGLPLRTLIALLPRSLTNRRPVKRGSP
jgi:hypothetical protein